MKSVVALLLVIISLPAHAGVIFGTLTANGQPLGQHGLSIHCSGGSASGGTNASGSFSIKVGPTGPCQLSISYGGQEVQYTVYSERASVRYDLNLSNRGGRWVLERR